MTIEAIEQVGVASGDGGGSGIRGRLPEGAARIMRITTDAGAFGTPARMVSYAEQAARSAIPLSRALPAELAMDFRVVRSGDGVASVLAAAASGDGAAPEPDRRAILYGDITERALLRVSVHQPTPAALDGMSSHARVRFADAQAALQPLDEPGGVATYPYLGLPASEYLRFIGDRLREEGSGSALFVLDAGMDGPTMEKILACLCDCGGPSLVPVIHGGAGGSLQNHAAVRRHLSQPGMAFLACQVPREMPAGGQSSSVSGPHAACFQQGFDMAAPAQQQQQRARRAPGARGLAATGFFSPETWRIDALSDALVSRGPRLVDEFLFGEDNGPDRRLVASVLERHAAAAAAAAAAAPGGSAYEGGGDPAGRRLLSHLARVHEAISSSAEFARVRAAILGHEAAAEAAASEIELPLLAQG